MSKHKRLVQPPAPVEATTFWLELDEQDVELLHAGQVPHGVIEATEFFLAALRSPAEGIAVASRLSRKAVQGV